MPWSNTNTLPCTLWIYTCKMFLMNQTRGSDLRVNTVPKKGWVKFDINDATNILWIEQKGDNNIFHYKRFLFGHMVLKMWFLVSWRRATASWGNEDSCLGNIWRKCRKLLKSQFSCFYTHCWEGETFGTGVRVLFSPKQPQFVHQMTSRTNPLSIKGNFTRACFHCFALLAMRESNRDKSNWS